MAAEQQAFREYLYASAPREEVVLELRRVEAERDQLWKAALLLDRALMERDGQPDDYSDVSIARAALRVAAGPDTEAPDA